LSLLICPEELRLEQLRVQVTVSLPEPDRTPGNPRSDPNVERFHAAHFRAGRSKQT